MQFRFHYNWIFTVITDFFSLFLGRPAVSRIAANFPKAESQAANSYSSIVQDMGNLGLGRGRSNKPNTGIFHSI